MTLSRRQLLASLGACGSLAGWSANAANRLSAVPSAATAGRPADPPARTQPACLKLSLAAYSFNRLFARRGTPEQIAQAKMTLEKFIDYGAEQQLAGVELTGYYFPQDISDEYLISLKQRTHRLGLDISGTAIGNDFCLPEGEARQQQLKDCRRWIDYAALMGAPVIRIFAGKTPKGDSEDAARERCVAGINECLTYAARRGVFLALENHGGITATTKQMMRIIDAVDDSPWFGVNFDSGNFRTDDPYRDLAVIAPYAVNAQIKVAVNPNNQGKQPADLKRIVDILKQAKYRGYVTLEFEERNPFDEIPQYLQQLRDLIS